MAITPEDMQQIRNAMKEEIRISNSNLRFQLTPIHRHIHNGIDSPFIYNPILSYIGYVQLDGVVLAVPQGWSVLKLSTGTYQITHNLNTDLYVAVVSPILSTTLPVASVTPGRNLFDVQWTNTADNVNARAVVDTTFAFIVVTTTNRKTAPPSYVQIGQ